MNKLLLLVLCLGYFSSESYSQCSTTSSPANDCSYGDQIDAFTLNSIPSTNSSGCASGGYGSYSTPVWTLQAGNTYNWSATTGNGTYYEGMGIWIDWNNDGNYASSEMVAATPYGFTHSGTIAVPANAASGVNIKMRVRCAYYETPANTDACTAYIGGYGETEDYNIFIPACAVVNVTSPGTVCAGTTASLVASGASTYSWVGGGSSATLAITPTANTTYTLMAAVGSTCNITKTTSIVLSPKTISTSANATVCPNTSVMIGATGAANYSWNNSVNTASQVVTPSVSSVYIVTGTNSAGCVASSSVGIDVYPQPTVTTVASSGAVCVNEPVTITAMGASTYLWSNSGTTNSVTLSSPTAGTMTFAVTGTDANGCTNTVNGSIIVDLCTGIYEQGLNQRVSIYPNPGSGLFIVGLEKVPSNSVIRVYSTNGALMREQVINSISTNIDLQKEANGVYLVEIFKEGKKVSSSKFVKQ